MKKSLTTEQYLDSLEKYRQDRGKYYNYEKVIYVSGNFKICIICPVHGEFLQRPGDHRSGSGCTICGKISAKETNLEKYGVDNPSKSSIIKKK